MITSLLDTDLYKLTMQAAVFENFGDAHVEYMYRNRTPTKKLNIEAVNWLKEQVSKLGDLRFSPEEIAFVKQHVGQFPTGYEEFLLEFQMKPAQQIEITEIEEPRGSGQYDLDVQIRGRWVETILYEIPVLALISESYFKFVDSDWDYEGQYEKAQGKILKLLENRVAFSDFGTRRRRSFRSQEIVIQAFCDAAAKESPEIAKNFIGTSNVLLAMRHGLKPIGTVAHEWFMGVAAIKQDYKSANVLAMQHWAKTYGPDRCGLILTDTFGTDDLLRHFYPPFSDLYTGFRQDSGDPKRYVDKVADHIFNKLHLAPFSKSICFSDSLNIEKCIDIQKYCLAKQIGCNFGVGTNFTNDFELKSNPSVKSYPMNIVIKLARANGNFAVKISDNMAKNMGDAATVHMVKEVLGYNETSWDEGDESQRWR